MNLRDKSAILKNHRPLLGISLSLALFFSLVATSARAAVIDFDSTYVYVVRASVAIDQLQLMNTGGTVLTATLPGFSSTATTLVSPTVSSIQFDQLRPGTFLDTAHGEAMVRFIAGSDESYSISGSFTNSGGWSRFNGSLFDHTTVSQVFLSAQVNIGATTLTLGNELGNDFNFLMGNTSGPLIPGHLYEWNSFAATQAFPSADGGGTGFGFASIEIVGPSALPEPGSITVLGGMVLVALLRCSRRKPNQPAEPLISRFNSPSCF